MYTTSDRTTAKPSYYEYKYEEPSSCQICPTGWTYCPYRLPCGTCMRTNKPCPYTSGFKITWTCGGTYPRVAGIMC